MFGNLGEMANLFQKAKAIQQNIGKLREEIASAVYEGVSEDGKVKVKISGDFQILDLVIDETAAPGEISLSVRAAVNTALETARSQAQAKMKELTGGLNIPGL